MNLFIKKIYFILIITCLIFFHNHGLTRESKEFSKDDISNYLSGIISSNKNFDDKALKHFSKVQFLKSEYQTFNARYIYTLILLEKFDEAFAFSKQIQRKNQPFFEVDLLLGLNYFLKKDYFNAEKYFLRVKKNSYTNFIFNDFLGDILIIWNLAEKNKEENVYKIFNNIPDRYFNLKQIQNIFLSCYLDSPKAEKILKETLENDDNNFPRYNYFYANYLISKNKIEEAKIVISRSRIKNSSNLLLKQTENFILDGKSKNVNAFFNCKNSANNIAEFFYIIANLYSTDKNYKLSNFYLKIALFLNKKFLPYKVLLAENYYHQNRIELSKKTFQSIKSIGPVYSWYSTKSIARMSIKESDAKESINLLEKELNLLTKINYEHYYELANFYNENEYYKKSIKYYSLALKNIEQNHFLVPKILFRRGTSYERLGDWENAEKDLSKSLKIEPDEPNVLNYLAYSWVEKKMNLNKSLEMLKRADKLKQNDGYIIDSLGWAYYARKNYNNAEKFLQKAIILMPQDPVINDHYADTLWMLNKNIQARYFWKYALNLESIEKELKDKIKLKLIFGINKNL